MKTATGVFSLLAIALMVLPTGVAQAQTDVVLSLDLFYADDSADNFPDATSNGTWQLYASVDPLSEGLAGLDVSITGINGTFGNDFLANISIGSGTAFKESFNGGLTPYDVDQDSDASTLDMLFAQVPVASPGPQDLVYGAGINGGASPNTDKLGAVVDTSGTSMTDAILLAYGTFGAGSTPAIDMTPGISGANVFTAQGTVADPPPVGTILSGLPFTAQTRTNLGNRKGDISLDTVVDALDYGILVTNFDGGASSEKFWQEGDVTGNKRVDAEDIGIVFASWNGDNPPATSAPLSATSSLAYAINHSSSYAGPNGAQYDPATGEIIVDLSGVNSWFIEHVGSDSLTGPASGSDTLPTHSGLVTDHDFRIGESGFSLFSTSSSLGSVAATGLPNDGTLRIFWNSGLGSPLESAEISFVPEPTTLGLSALGLIIIVTRRKRA